MSALTNALNKGKNAAKKADHKQETQIADLQFLPLEIARIHPDPDQPRKEWIEGELEELAASIEQTKGCHTPIKVRPHPSIIGEFMLVYGEGRWRSHGLKNIPIINALIDYSEMSEQALYENFYVQVTENISRIPMKKFDEAIAVAKLMNDHKPKKLNQKQLAEKIGKSTTYINRLLKILDAPSAIQDLSRLNITQNLNVISSLAKAAEFVSEQELQQLIDEVTAGDLGEKALQKHIAELQEPQAPIKKDNEAGEVTHTNSTDTDNQMDLDDYLANQEREDYQQEERQETKDYGFYNYENQYDKAVFDALIKHDLAFEITEEQKDEASENLKVVTLELEELEHKRSELLKLFVSKLQAESAVKTILNKRSLRRFFNDAIKQKAESREKLQICNFYEMANFEVIDGVILVTVEGLDKPIKFSQEDVNQFNEAF